MTTNGPAENPLHVHVYNMAGVCTGCGFDADDQATDHKFCHPNEQAMAKTIRKLENLRRIDRDLFWEAIRQRDSARVAIDDYGRCRCCGEALGCHCHEYPHDDKPECPGRTPESPRPRLQFSCDSGHEAIHFFAFAVEAKQCPLCLSTLHARNCDARLAEIQRETEPFGHAATDQCDNEASCVRRVIGDLCLIPCDWKDRPHLASEHVPLTDAKPGIRLTGDCERCGGFLGKHYCLKCGAARGPEPITGACAEAATAIRTEPPERWYPDDDPATVVPTTDGEAASVCLFGSCLIDTFTDVDEAFALRDKLNEEWAKLTRGAK